MVRFGAFLKPFHHSLQYLRVGGGIDVPPGSINSEAAELQ